MEPYMDWPGILGALAILLVGWLVAGLFRSLTLRLIRWLERGLRTLSKRYDVSAAQVPSRTAEILSRLVFWIIILLAIVLAGHAIGIDAFASLLYLLAAYLPTLLVGGLIILVGYLLSILARDIVIAAAQSTGRGQQLLLGRIVQFSILILAIIIGAGQMGINVTLLIVLVAIVTTALLGGVTLAVSLGARSFVSNLIGAYYCRRTYKPGQRIRIGEYEGTLIELTTTMILLDTPEGQVALPAKLYNDEPSILLTESGAHDQ